MIDTQFVMWLLGWDGGIQALATMDVISMGGTLSISKFSAWRFRRV